VVVCGVQVLVLLFQASDWPLDGAVDDTGRP